VAIIDASCEYPGRDDALIGYCGLHCWTAVKLEQMPPRRFASGDCRRCGVGYVALSEEEANGACGLRCARVLARRRAQRRKHEKWMWAHLDELCPRCGKQMITEEWRAGKAAKRATVRYRKPVSHYECPAGYGWHLTSHPRDSAECES
jgi:hypothetical protein